MYSANMMSEEARRRLCMRFVLTWRRVAFVLLLSLHFIVADENITTTTKRPPVELFEIGFDGSWEQFCDRARIEREFPYFEHDLKSIRLMICRMKEADLFRQESLLAFASYKYCLMMRPRFDQLLEEFLEKLSAGDPENRMTLLTVGSVKVSACYNESLPAFTQHCVGGGSPCFKLFRLILGRACFAPWLTTEKILSGIEEVCAGKYISDEIDWKTILMTINYRDDE